jgi:hypothetical protein
MKFELWQSKEVWTFFPVDKYCQQQRKYLEQTSSLQWSVEASSYDEAMKLYYDYKGWNDYVPMEEGFYER